MWQWRCFIHSSIHTLLPTLLRRPSHTKNLQYPMNSTSPGKYYLITNTLCTRLKQQHWYILTNESIHLHNLPILQLHTQIAPPTPPNTIVNPNKKRSKLYYSNTPINNDVHIRQIPNYQSNLPLKFRPLFNYYTNGWI